MPWRLLKKIPGVKASRRRMVLVLIGLTWIAYGFGVLSDPYPEARFGHVINFLSPFLDGPYTGVMWLLSGAVAICAGVTLVKEPVGFRALVIPPVLWAGLFSWSWVTYLLSDVGNGRGWVAASAWLALTLLVSVTAGWPDVPDAVDEGG